MESAWTMSRCGGTQGLALYSCFCPQSWHLHTEACLSSQRRPSTFQTPLHIIQERTDTGHEKIYCGMMLEHVCIYASQCEHRCALSLTRTGPPETSIPAPWILASPGSPPCTVFFLDPALSQCLHMPYCLVKKERNPTFPQTPFLLPHLAGLPHPPQTPQLAPTSRVTREEVPALAFSGTKGAFPSPRYSLVRKAFPSDFNSFCHNESMFPDPQRKYTNFKICSSF